MCLNKVEIILLAGLFAMPVLTLADDTVTSVINAANNYNNNLAWLKTIDPIADPVAYANAQQAVSDSLNAMSGSQFSANQTAQANGSTAIKNAADAAIQAGKTTPRFTTQINPATNKIITNLNFPVQTSIVDSEGNVLVDAYGNPIQIKSGADVYAAESALDVAETQIRANARNAGEMESLFYHDPVTGARLIDPVTGAPVMAITKLTDDYAKRLVDDKQLVTDAANVTDSSSEQFKANALRQSAMVKAQTIRSNRLSYIANLKSGTTP